MTTNTASFYRFCAVHSLLIGLLPFFIPVILWQQGFGLAQISLFVAITGLGFMVSLRWWQSLYQRSQWRQILALSFIAELGLIAVIISADNTVLLIGGALLNGMYNCFYWTTQRVMFSAMTNQNRSKKTSNKTGRQYGNFQILVVFLLKLGILIGAYLQENQHFELLFGTSFFLSLLAILVLLRADNDPKIERKQAKPLSKRNKLVFAIDGVFLFFESYFWVLSLFFISRGNVFELGLMLVALTLVLSLIFMVIKNTIDRLNQHYVFYSAVVLYALSCALRGMLTVEIEGVSLYLLILLIAFLTSFFRLSFNKRFFDHANQLDALNIIWLKSYLSQGAIVIFFAVLATVLFFGDATVADLPALYWLLAPAGLLYALYGPTPVTTKHLTQLSGSDSINYVPTHDKRII
ncbi:MAG: MFS transporter [Gammaproteobacteria bacterium]|nr:MFS transporter [Gammaproteobacteria bacterium]